MSRAPAARTIPRVDSLPAVAKRIIWSGSCQNAAVDMLPEIDLDGFPPSFSSLSWSEDGDVAVATGEHVHVMIPTVTLLDGSSHSDSDWDLVKIQVNSFTPEEVAHPKPGSFAIFSIGEEVSESEATSMAWSPAGPATHRRAVLTVLTANHTLSLWDAANPRQEVNWKRALIVNRSLQNHLGDRWPLDSDRNLEAHEVQRLRGRIRTYAWSHTCRLGPDDQWGVPLLAVANNYNEIVITRVLSPCNGLAKSSDKWDLDVLAWINLKNASDISAGRPSRRRTALSGLQFASNLAWSPWWEGPCNGQTSLLAYVYEDRLYIQKISVRNEDPTDEGSEGGNSLAVTVDPAVFNLHAPRSGPDVRLIWHDEVGAEFVIAGW